MPYLKTDSVNLYYERAGQGTPLLLVPGMGSDSATWRAIWKPLTAEFDVIAIDIRCTGRTTPTPSEITANMVVNDIEALLEHLNIDKLAIVGHSLGALLSWRFAHKHPKRITSMVVASGGFGTTTARVDLFNTLISLRNDENELTWFKLYFYLIFRDAFFADPSMADSMAEMAASYPQKQSIDAFTTQIQLLNDCLKFQKPTSLDYPVLGITGDQDRLFSVDEMHEVYGDVPNMQLQVIKDSGHSLQWENPVAFTKAILDFLKPAPQ